MFWGSILNECHRVLPSISSRSQSVLIKLSQPVFSYNLFDLLFLFLLKYRLKYLKMEPSKSLSEGSPLLNRLQEACCPTQTQRIVRSVTPINRTMFQGFEWYVA